MRAPKIAMLIVGLALCAGQTLAQPSQPQYSADGLYNLANSYARAGKPGLAVLNYERAALLAPDDPDINANLEYVRASAHVATEPRSRFARIAQAASPSLGGMGSESWELLLSGWGLLARRIARRFQWMRIGGIVLGVALIALTASNAMLLWPRMHEAVVLVNQTPARVSPVPMGDTAFVLPEAETVTITAEHEDFVLIRTRRRPLGMGRSRKSRRRGAASRRLRRAAAFAAARALTSLRKQRRHRAAAAVSQRATIKGTLNGR